MSIQQAPGEARPVADNAAQQYPITVAPSVYMDSVQIYQNLIDQQSAKGQSFRHTEQPFSGAESDFSP